MDIRTVKHTIWKGVGDMKLYYREAEKKSDDKEVDNGDEQITASTVNSN